MLYLVRMVAIKLAKQHLLVSNLLIIAPTHHTPAQQTWKKMQVVQTVQTMQAVQAALKDILSL